MINITTSWIAGSIGRDAAREVFGPDRSVAAGTTAPMGRAVEVDGGLRLSGRWAWGSGVHNSSWMACGALVEPASGGDGRARVVMAVVPIGAITVLDTWHTTGMRGTGSTDYECHEVFVPWERVVDPSRPLQATPRVPAATTRPGADPLAVAERYRQAQGAQGKQEVGPDLLVFVSFAMPKGSLTRLAADAGKAGAILVFRGPREGSIRKTLAAFEPLARLGARATLDPEAFAGQRIEAVPVYLLGQAGGCGEASACAEVLRISGDAGLDDILERMARADHPLAQVAEGRLARLRGAP